MKPIGLISKAGIFIGFGHWSNNMFRLNTNKTTMFDYYHVDASINSIIDTSIYDLWHARLGHVHQKRMLEMAKNEIIPTFDQTLEKCKTCMLSKIIRLSFKRVDREE